MSPHNVMEAICAAFEKEPPGCVRFLKKEKIVLDHDGVSKHFLYWVVAIMVCVAAVTFVAYRRCLQTEMESEMKMQVSSAVSQYVALS